MIPFSGTLATALAVVAIGTGATAVHDAWTMLRRAFGVAPPDWARVGRWIGWLPRGRFVHAPIAAPAPVRGERLIGWLAHYGIGIAFWMDGAPGRAVIVKVAAPSAIAPGMSRFGIPACLNNVDATG